jgi:D-glycero-D-manno-heptose 1,7-bisphosphate phosphatase
MNRAVFLDRDGVINKAVIKNGKPYPPKNLDTLELIDNVKDLLHLLKKEGFKLIVVTNQPDVARKKISKRTVDLINNYLLNLLPIDNIETCFHDDSDNCICRKPLPGLILSSAKRYNIDLKKSYLIGDRWKDIAAGKAANCKTIFIDYNYDEINSIRADITTFSLKEAVEKILTDNEKKNEIFGQS